MGLTSRLAPVCLGLYAVTLVYIVLAGVVRLPFFALIVPFSTIFFFAFSLFHAGASLGWRRALLFLAVTVVVTFGFEAVGVLTGRIYGPYSYTERLGPRLLGLVPVYIPMAWFMMGYVAYALVRQLAVRLRLPDGRRTNLWVTVTAAVAMTAWDLTMDPLMVAGGHWVWHVQGAYFGIPAQNYVGWLVTVMTVYLLYHALASRFPAAATPPTAPWWLALPWLAYTLAAAVNLITALERGLFGPAVAGFFGMAPFVLVGMWTFARPHASVA